MGSDQQVKKNCAARKVRTRSTLNGSLFSSLTPLGRLDHYIRLLAIVWVNLNRKNSMSQCIFP